MLAAQLAEMLYLGGLPVRQAAEVLGKSVSTAYRHWAYARAWLYVELCRED
ncbi:MAG: ECF-type sigma factor [Thermoguttaceae bacterium]|nr:ECF-type sigma factor [Thermoguttaceae bacterium]MDW8077437.1 ECF-type sigma factor [Thermoguttaceae bacterium]